MYFRVLVSTRKCIIQYQKDILKFTFHGNFDFKRFRKVYNRSSRVSSGIELCERPEKVILKISNFEN